MKAHNSITVIGRRWFQRTYGNTYFSAVGIVDGKEVVSISFEYGYGDHYIDRIADELEKAGYLPDRKHYDNGGAEPLWHYCQTQRGCEVDRPDPIRFNYSVSDVSRKKDL